ncbi:hypothetical protein GJ744_010274 [Endocarpon pusillum]|uniref:DNA topoisomerase (ATP-hydrolyzing) n=1 Tax=Endocarpon pusillum TaxID=364733 RepID=A0A8H7AHN3_9EURO|nr:hypothetical protein GJ744_010274 [Endocarpon pusillum]
MSSRGQPLDYIETTFLDILSEIEKRPCGRPKITLKRIVGDDPHQCHQVTEREVTYSWPGKNREEAWRFACVGKILAEIHEALHTGVTVTKRDIYYRDPELYGKQALVDRYVDDIAYTCNVTRRKLNVTASAKGLHVGLLQSCLAGSTPNASFEAVPDSIQRLQEHSLAHLNWILVIEKEATFRSLVEKRFQWNSINGPGLMMTGKGYPDLATRRFLRTICDHETWLHRRRPCIFGLFDADPDGINIMQIYCQGSQSLPHETELNVPEMQWLGVRAADVLAEVQNDESVLKLTSRDRKKAVAMLGRLNRESEAVVDEQCKIELQRILVLNVKAEIQLLEDRPGGLEGWLNGRIRMQLRKSIHL